jgi:hypothetical protein
MAGPILPDQPADKPNADDIPRQAPKNWTYVDQNLEYVRHFAKGAVQKKIATYQGYVEGNILAERNNLTNDPHLVAALDAHQASWQRFKAAPESQYETIRDNPTAAAAAAQVEKEHRIADFNAAIDAIKEQEKVKEGDPRWEQLEAIRKKIAAEEEWYATRMLPSVLSSKASLVMMRQHTGKFSEGNAKAEAEADRLIDDVDSPMSIGFIPAVDEGIKGKVTSFFSRFGKLFKEADRQSQLRWITQDKDGKPLDNPRVQLNTAGMTKHEATGALGGCVAAMIASGINVNPTPYGRKMVKGKLKPFSPKDKWEMMNGWIDRFKLKEHGGSLEVSAFRAEMVKIAAEGPDKKEAAKAIKELDAKVENSRLGWEATKSRYAKDHPVPPKGPEISAKIG